jgi:hypothetical protein
MQKIAFGRLVLLSCHKSTKKARLNGNLLKFPVFFARRKKLAQKTKLIFKCIMAQTVFLRPLRGTLEAEKFSLWAQIPIMPILNRLRDYGLLLVSRGTVDFRMAVFKLLRRLMPDIAAPSGFCLLERDLL